MDATDHAHAHAGTAQPLDEKQLDAAILQKTGELTSLERCIEDASEEVYHLRQRRQLLLNEVQFLEDRLRYSTWLYAYAEGLLKRYGMEPEEKMSNALQRAYEAFSKSRPGELPGDDALNAPAPAPRPSTSRPTKSPTGQRRRIEISIPLDDDELLY